MEAPTGNLRELRLLYPGKFKFPAQQPFFPLLVHKSFEEDAIKQAYCDPLFSAPKIEVYSTAEIKKGLFAHLANAPADASEEKRNAWTRHWNDILANEKWVGGDDPIVNKTKVYIKPERQKNGRYLMQTHAAVPIAKNDVICVVGGHVVRYNSLQELKDKVNPEEELLVLPFPYVEISHYYRKSRNFKHDVEVRGPINPENPLVIETFLVSKKKLTQMNQSTFIKYARPKEEHNAELWYQFRTEMKTMAGTSRRRNYFYLVATRNIKANEKILLEMTDWEDWVKLKPRRHSSSSPPPAAPSSVIMSKKGSSVSGGGGDDVVEPSPVAGRTRSKKKRSEDDDDRAGERLPAKKRSRPLVPPFSSPPSTRSRPATAPPPQAAASAEPSSPSSSSSPSGGSGSTPSPAPDRSTPSPAPASVSPEGMSPASAPLSPEGMVLLSPQGNSSESPSPHSMTHSTAQTQTSKSPSPKKRSSQTQTSKSPSPESVPLTSTQTQTSKSPSPETAPFVSTETQTSKSPSPQPHPQPHYSPISSYAGSPKLPEYTFPEDFPESILPQQPKPVPKTIKIQQKGAKDLVFRPANMPLEITSPPGDLPYPLPVEAAYSSSGSKGTSTASSGSTPKGRTPPQKSPAASPKQPTPPSPGAAAAGSLPSSPRRQNQMQVVSRPQTAPATPERQKELPSHVIRISPFLRNPRRRDDANFYRLLPFLVWPSYPYVRVEREVLLDRPQPERKRVSDSPNRELQRPATAPLGLSPESWGRVANVDPRSHQVPVGSEAAIRIRNIVMSNSSDPVPTRDRSFPTTPRTQEITTPWWLVEFPQQPSAYLFHDHTVLNRHRIDEIRYLRDLETRLTLRNLEASLNPAYGLGSIGTPKTIYSSGLVIYDKTMPMKKNLFNLFVKSELDVPDEMRLMWAKSYTLGAWHRRPREGLNMDQEIEDISGFVNDLFDCAKVDRLVDATEDRVNHALGNLRDITDKLVFHCQAHAMIVPIVVFSAVSYEKHVIYHTPEGKPLKVTDLTKQLNHYFGAHDSSPQYAFPVLIFVGPSGFNKPTSVKSPELNVVFHFPVPLGSTATVKQCVCSMDTLVECVKAELEAAAKSGESHFKYVPQQIGERCNLKSAKRIATSKQMNDQRSKTSVSIQGNMDPMAGMTVSSSSAKFGTVTLMGSRVRGLHLVATYDDEFLTELTTYINHVERIFNMYMARKPEVVLVNKRDEMVDAVDAMMNDSTAEYLLIVVSTRDGTDTSFLMGRTGFLVEYSWLFSRIKAKSSTKSKKKQNLKGVVIIPNHGQGLVTPRPVHRCNAQAYQEITTSDARSSSVDVCTLGSYTGEFVRFETSACPLHAICLESRDMNLANYGATMEDIMTLHNGFKLAIEERLGPQRHLVFPNDRTEDGELLPWEEVEPQFETLAAPIKEGVMGGPGVAEGQFISLPFTRHGLALKMDGTQSPNCTYGSPAKSTHRSSGDQSWLHGPVAESPKAGSSQPNQPPDASPAVPETPFSYEKDAEFRALVKSFKEKYGKVTIRGQAEKLKITVQDELEEQILQLVNSENYAFRKIDIFGTQIPFGSLANLLPGGLMTPEQVYAYGRVIRTRNEIGFRRDLLVVPASLLTHDISFLEGYLKKEGHALFHDTSIGIFVIDESDPEKDFYNLTFAVYDQNFEEIKYFKMHPNDNLRDSHRHKILGALQIIFAEWNGKVGLQKKVLSTERIRVTEVKYTFEGTLSRVDSGVVACQAMEQIAVDTLKVVIKMENMKAYRLMMFLELCTGTIVNRTYY